jgi:hypothetical protein
LAENASNKVNKDTKINFFIFSSYQIVLVVNNEPYFANPSLRPPFGRPIGGLPHEDTFVLYLCNGKAFSNLTAKVRALR